MPILYSSNDQPRASASDDSSLDPGRYYFGFCVRVQRFSANGLMNGEISDHYLHIPSFYHLFSLDFDVWLLLFWVVSYSSNFIRAVCRSNFVNTAECCLDESTLGPWTRSWAYSALIACTDTVTLFVTECYHSWLVRNALSVTHSFAITLLSFLSATGSFFLLSTTSFIV